NHTRTARTFAEVDLTCATRKARRVRRRRLCRNNDARQAGPRSGYGKFPDVVAGEPHPKTRRPGRLVADPTVQLREAFVPLTLPTQRSTLLTLRYSLIGPDNTLFGECSPHLLVSVPPAEWSAVAPCRWSATRPRRSSCVPAACNTGSPARS